MLHGCQTHTIPRKAVRSSFLEDLVLDRKQCCISMDQNRKSFFETICSKKVASIQESTETNQWHHILGKKNPADIASRGIDICELNTPDNTWFLGPLRQSVDQWPSSEQALDYTAVKVGERKLKHAIHSVVENKVLEIESFSCLRRLRNIVAYVRKAFKRKRSPKFNREDAEQGLISLEEIQEAEMWLIKQEQKRFFENELMDLINKRQVSKKSSIKSLNPFIDESGLIRVGGRFRRASLEYDEKHQIILPKESYLTAFIIREIHESKALWNKLCFKRDEIKILANSRKSNSKTNLKKLCHLQENTRISFGPIDG